MSTSRPNSIDPHIAPELIRSALVIIDTQNDFLDGGSSPIPGTTAALPTLAGLIAAYRDVGRPIIHVVRLYDGTDVDRPRRGALAQGAPIVRPSTVGSQIAPPLRPPSAPDLDPVELLAGHVQALGPREVVLWKPRWSAFYRTALDAHLMTEGVTTVVIAGCNFPNCPRATLYDASERDYRVVLVTDATSGIEPWHLAETAGIGVVALTASDVKSGLQGPARPIENPSGAPHGAPNDLSAVAADPPVA